MIARDLEVGSFGEVVEFPTQSGIAVAMIARKGGVMSDQAGIWIDHEKAVIVTISGEDVSLKTLVSDVGPHTQYAGSPVTAHTARPRPASASTSRRCAPRCSATASP